MKLVPLTSLLIVALVAPRASAGPSAGKPASAAEASGRAHFQRGQKLSARGDYAAAYREFAAGYALTERPLFLFNMAEAARANGELAKARENYLAFLRADPDNAMAATAQARLAELDPAAGATPRSGPPAPPAITQPGATGPRADPILLLPPSSIAAQPVRPEVLDVRRPDNRDDAPLWKSWPFWAVVAGSVVAGGAVVYVATRDASPCGTDCTEVNFR